MATPKMSKWEQEGWDAAMKKAGGTGATRMRPMPPISKPSPTAPPSYSPFPENVLGLKLDTIVEIRRFLLELYDYRVNVEDITPAMIAELRRAVAGGASRAWASTSSHYTHPPHGIISM